MCLGKRAVLLAAVAGALLSASVARANGDPASDYLLTQNVFLPFTQTIDQNEVKRLDALLKEANRQHYRIRVAIILSPALESGAGSHVHEAGYATEVARKLYDLRTKAGLSQRELARVVGTTASVVCHLEVLSTYLHTCHY